jgi:hypothetical protein
MSETLIFPSGFPSLEGEWSPRALFSVHPVPFALATLMVVVIAYAWNAPNSSWKNLPHINPSKFFSDAEAKASLSVRNS